MIICVWSWMIFISFVTWCGRIAATCFCSWISIIQWRGVMWGLLESEPQLMSWCWLEVTAGEEDKKASAAPPTQYHDAGNCQGVTDSWLEDNRNCCRSMHAPMTALLLQICDSVCVINRFDSPWVKLLRCVSAQRNTGEGSLVRHPSWLTPGPPHLVHEEMKLYWVFINN